MRLQRKRHQETEAYTRPEKSRDLEIPTTDIPGYVDPSARRLKYTGFRWKMVRYIIGYLLGAPLYQAFMMYSFDYYFPIPEGVYYGIDANFFSNPITDYAMGWIFTIFTLPVILLIVIVSTLLCELINKGKESIFLVPVYSLFHGDSSSKIFYWIIFSIVTGASTVIFHHYIDSRPGCPSYQANFIAMGFALGLFLFLAISYFPVKGSEV